MSEFIDYDATRMMVDATMRAEKHETAARDLEVGANLIDRLREGYLVGDEYPPLTHDICEILGTTNPAEARAILVRISEVIGMAVLHQAGAAGASRDSVRFLKSRLDNDAAPEADVALVENGGLTGS